MKNSGWRTRPRNSAQGVSFGADMVRLLEIPAFATALPVRLTIALGAFVVDFGVVDLQLPETGDEEEKDRNGGILESGHFGGGKAGVVAKLDLARLGPLIEMVFERGEAHGQRRS